MNQDNELLANLTAEQSVVGALIIEGTRFGDVSEILKATDFHFAANRNIYLAAESLFRDNTPIDVITLAEKIQAATGIDPLDYLTELSDGVTSSANISAYAKIVKDLSVKRMVLAACRGAQETIVGQPKLTGAESIEIAQSAVIALSDSQTDELDVSYIDDALKRTIDNLKTRLESGDEIDGLSSGLVGIDSQISGYKPGNLVIIAGRPGMGKTTLALQMACHMWTQQRLNGLIFSLEMSTDELMQKAIACTGKIPLDLFKNPTQRLLGEHTPALHAANHLLKGKSAYIVDCAGIHINQVKAYARKAHKRKKLDFIMVDHIHIMSGDGHSPTHVIGDISKGLKHLAKELHIPIFALAQLNRGVESRVNKRPLISDLRDSGSVEQDADIIQLLYREDYYKEDGDGDGPNDGLLEVNTAKFRNGQRGTRVLEHHLDQSRVEDTRRFITYEEPKKLQRGYA